MSDGKLLDSLRETQKALLANAVNLLSPTNAQAEVWYMTCSILRSEDEVRRGRAVVLKKGGERAIG